MQNKINLRAIVCGHVQVGLATLKGSRVVVQPTKIMTSIEIHHLVKNQLSTLCLTGNPYIKPHFLGMNP